MTTERNCPDCQGDLNEVRILDQAHGHVHIGEISYAAADAKQSFWSGRFPIAGKVQGFLCADCGRILLYGVPGGS